MFREIRFKIFKRSNFAEHHTQFSAVWIHHVTLTGAVCRRKAHLSSPRPCSQFTPPKSASASPRVISHRHRVDTEKKNLSGLETWKSDRQLSSFHIHARHSGAAEGLRGVLLTGRAEQTNPIKAFSAPNSCCSDLPWRTDAKITVKTYDDDECYNRVRVCMRGLHESGLSSWAV